MLCFRNHSDTLFVVLHEIYGINRHITEVCKVLCDTGYDVVCPDLLSGRPSCDYSREEEAYRYFANYEGFESSAKKVIFLLRQEELAYRQIFLMGYSIGATIAWLCCGDSADNRKGFSYGGQIKSLKGMIGYYGSRIRDYTRVNPKCPVLLFFPEEEKSFEPLALVDELRKKEHTEVHILKGKHGFADPYSGNYNAVSASEADRILKRFLILRENEKGRV